MSNQSSNHTSKIVIGLLLAGITGFVAGTMLASKSGKKFREDIEDSGEELLHVLKTKLGEFKEKAQDKFKDIKQFGEDGFNESAMSVQDKVIELGRQLDQLLNRAKSNGNHGKKEKVL